MEIKHYIDIEQLREIEIDLGNGIKRAKNDDAFEEGDIISITEKVDGSNASFRYDIETNQLIAFSRRLKLTFDNTLNGFYNFVKNLDASRFKNISQLSIFGEWMGVRNKIVYNPEIKGKWIVYSIYDNDKKIWLDQEFVKRFCKDYDFEYVHELYYGPFISWEHCRSFSHSPYYGDTQEGIVVRNITKLHDESCRMPHVLKIVNEDYLESKKIKERRKDNSEKDEEKARAVSLMESIVTRNRIEKILFKLVEDNILPKEIEPKDMAIVAKCLPKLVYEDVLKEEKEIVEACGDYAGKACATIAMKHAKNIIIG